MSSDELLVLDYLKRFPNTFTNASQICEHASIPHRYAAEPQWACPALQILEINGHLETDELGHYRIAPALLAKYIEHFRRGQRAGGGCKAVAERIMAKALEDDDKPFSALICESLASKHANEGA